MPNKMFFVYFPKLMHSEKRLRNIKFIEMEIKLIVEFSQILVACIIAM